MDKRIFELTENTSPSSTHKIVVSSDDFLEDKYMELEDLKAFTKPGLSTLNVSGMTLEGNSITPIIDYSRYQLFGSLFVSFAIGVNLSWSAGDVFVITFNHVFTGVTVGEYVNVDVIYNNVYQETLLGKVIGNTPLNIEFAAKTLNNGGTFIFVVNENLL